MQIQLILATESGGACELISGEILIIGILRGGVLRKLLAWRERRPQGSKVHCYN